MEEASGLTRRPSLPALAAGLTLVAIGWPADATERLDPYARAVVESVAHPPPTTPRELLAAAAKTADVEALEAATAYVQRLADAVADAGNDRSRLIAELSADADPLALHRLGMMLRTTAPDLLPAIEALEEAARLQRRDPRRLARAAAELGSDSYATRAAAATTLGRAGLDALPALVGVLGSDDDAGLRARDIARGLVRDLGHDARRPLLDSLGSADIGSWPGVIAALDAIEADDVEEFLLAPAVVADTPPVIRDRALAALRQARRRDGDSAPWQPPTRSEAVARIGRRLDHLLVTAENPHARRPDEATDVSRSREALHLARDLSALGATGPEAVRLVLLARLEALVAQTPAAELESPRIAAALTGPDGADVGTIGDVLDLATSRGLFAAAATAARGLEEALLPPDLPLGEPAAPLPPAVRGTLVRALAVPEAALQFAAARTLALSAPPPPWPGSSRVVATLAHAATAEGSDRVVVAHHDAAVAQEIAAGVSRFGYRPVTVSTGRAAVLAAREHADTVLVILGARIILPKAFETMQFIHEQPYGDIPPILIVVDPLDDEARGRFLSKSILEYSGVPCVALVDRMESLFQPLVDAKTGRELMTARFPALLEDLAGQQAAAVEARAARAALRRDRGRQAAALLSILDRRGWEIPETTRTRLGLTAARRGAAGYNRSSPPPSPSTSADAAIPEPTR